MNLDAVRLRSAGRPRRWPAALLLVAAVLVALTLGLASLAAARTVSFPDVPSSHPYHDAIVDLASRGIVNGYGSGDFGPADEVMRQQFAKMIVLTGEYPVSEDDVCHFTDVQKSGAGGLYPDNYVAVCAATGITTGKTSTTFDPYSKITRYQVITMVVRMADDLQPALLPAPPADWTATGVWGDDPTHGAKAARAECNGLLAGLDVALLSPYGNMSRGEVAQVLSNLRSKITAATTTTEPPTTTTEVPVASTTTTSSTTTTTACVP